MKGLFFRWPVLPWTHSRFPRTADPPADLGNAECVRLFVRLCWPVSCHRLFLILQPVFEVYIVCNGSFNSM